MFSLASAGPLRLNCLVLGDRLNNIFVVEIAGTRSVGWLKEEIKVEKPSYNHIDASDLVLWKVSEVVDQNLENNLKNANFLEEEALSSHDILWEVFPSLPIEGRLHIVIWPPEDCKLCGSLCVAVPSH